jgi:hypothetical protein
MTERQEEEEEEEEEKGVRVGRRCCGSGRGSGVVLGKE